MVISHPVGFPASYMVQATHVTLLAHVFRRLCYLRGADGPRLHTQTFATSYKTKPGVINRLDKQRAYQLQIGYLADGDWESI